MEQERCRMSEWKSFQLEKLIVLHDSRRIPLSSLEREKRRGSYPYYGAASIVDYVDDYLYDGDYILFGEDGTVITDAGKPILQIAHGKFWVNNHAHVITVTDLADFRFIYYALKNTDVRAIVTGAVQPKISQANLKTLRINIPPLPTQRKIAAVLGALDDKIENNRKICENLEAQAQAIFKSWFVDFEPFGGKMPQGWKEVPLSSIATYLNGLAMQKYRPSDDEDSLPVLKIKELRQGFCDSASERCSASIDPRYVIHDGDVIFSWSGSLLVDFWCGGTAGLNQHLFKVYSDKYDKWFVYSWTNHYLASFIKIAADKATTMGHITRDHLDDAKVCIPFDSDIEQVGRVMKPLYDEIITKRIESRALAATRDALLPKLMSGEIDVEKVQVA